MDGAQQWGADGALWVPQTNTYQAVLSTDGSRSFALLLYQDGGMRWDYAGLAARDALIGFSRCCVLVCVPPEIAPALSSSVAVSHFKLHSPRKTHKAAQPQLETPAHSVLGAGT